MNTKREIKRIKKIIKLVNNSRLITLKEKKNIFEELSRALIGIKLTYKRDK